MDLIAYILGLLFGGILTFTGKFIGFLFAWFVMFGFILERVASKSGHTGTLYRWLLGLPFISAVPFGLSLVAEQSRGAEVFGSIHLVIYWLTFIYLSLAPWPVRRER
jgi:hypothetical protein